ncbi:fluoride efflux transporter CrcB [Nonomuraea pusilla]|uniref:Fluoride-specific ion channel FluC n=1 Tax=Nonomuraea pusilla TaxID=46177 RepID=A0A1H8H885_9ACTN|nr:fluoride efflux transporter CrcB [Nonomuraea pusilla]SEN51997.1 CrcB protein [Nonomuraea pusilla]
MTVVLVFLGGAVGAPARYLLDRLIQKRHDTVFPWGTFTVNMVGSLVLGFLLGAGSGVGVPRELSLLLGTGVCGALTTFSTFGFETMRLVEEGSLLEAGLNALGSLLLGVLAAFCGYELATLL